MAGCRIWNFLVEENMNNKNVILRDSNFWTNLFKAPTESEDLESVLRTMPPFEKIRNKSLTKLMELLHNRVYQPNEHIFYQGDPGIGLFILRDGEVKIDYHTQNGKIHELTTLTRGDFFGEMAMLEDDKRSASAIAIKESNVYVIFKPDLDEFIDRNPKEGIKILRGISKILATRLRKANKDYFTLFLEQE